MINSLDELYFLKRVAQNDNESKDPHSIFDQITDFDQTTDTGQNFLHIAVSNLDLPGINFFLEKGVSVGTDEYNNNLLHTLANSSYLSNYEYVQNNEQLIYDITKLLLDKNVKPKRKNDSDRIAYVMAAEKFAYPILKALAESGLKMDASMSNGMNLMHYVLEKSGYNKVPDVQATSIEKTIEALIESGLDPEDKDAWDKTPDYYARKADLLGVVAILLGEDKDTVSPADLMSLKDALGKKLYDVADQILENGADINEVDETNQMTPLMWSCLINDLDAVKYLIAKGVDVDYLEGVSGKSAMSIALAQTYMHLRMGSPNDLVALVKTLCNATKDINSIIDDKGNTALNLLCKQGNMYDINTKLVELLIDMDADLNITDLEGLTPMMSFARDNGEELNLNIIETLIDEGADVTHKDKTGNTVLSYAAMNCRDNDARKIAELVLNEDNSIAGYANVNGKTPIDLAVEAGKEACAKVILMNM